MFKERYTESKRMMLQGKAFTHELNVERKLPACNVLSHEECNMQVVRRNRGRPALSVAWSHTNKPRSSCYSIGILTLCDFGSFTSDTLQS